MSPGFSPWMVSCSCPAVISFSGGQIDAISSCSIPLSCQSPPSSPAHHEGHGGKPSERSQRCCSWTEKLHFPPCAVGKRPEQPRGCSNCLKQPYYCFLTAGMRQFLCFPLLGSCQQSSTTLRAFILPLPKGWLLHPMADWLTLAPVPGRANLASCLQAGSATSSCLQWERSSFFSGLAVRCRIYFLLQHQHRVGNS